MEREPSSLFAIGLAFLSLHLPRHACPKSKSAKVASVLRITLERELEGPKDLLPDELDRVPANVPHPLSGYGLPRARLQKRAEILLRPERLPCQVGALQGR